MSKHLIFNQISKTEKIELGLLALLVFFLPLRETPKTVFLIAYLVFWIFHRVKNKNWGKTAIFFDLPLVFIIFLGLISSISSPFDQVNSFEKSLEFSFAALLAIFIRRSHYPFHLVLKILLISITLSVAVAITEGFIYKNSFPYLRSVGHINQVANYLAICFAIIFSIAVLFRNSKACWIFWIISIFFLLSAFATQSRNAALACGIVIFITIFTAPKKQFFEPKLLSLACVFGFMFLALMAPSGIYEKQLSHLSSGSLDSGRLNLWRTALRSVEARLLFGYGPGTFESATSFSHIENLTKENNEKFISNDFSQASHGHNLLIHWLTERGFISLVLLLLWLVHQLRISFLSLRYASQFRDRISEHSFLIQRLVPAQISLGVCAAVLALGVGNTPLRVEHGILVMLLVGLVYPNITTKHAG